MNDKECCYDHMSNKTGGQSQPSECHDEPYRNEYENSKSNSNGYDQSGMRGK